jgi:undecaprenyl diphosphate synthase
MAPDGGAGRARPRWGHVVIIPDGNRRWAREHGLPVAEGYAAGVAPGLAAVEWALDAGIAHLSAYGSSLANLEQRGPEQVIAIHAAVYALCVEAARMPELAVHVFGAPERIPPFVPQRAALMRLAERPPPAARLVLHVGVGYSPHDELAALAAAARSTSGEGVARDPERFLCSAGVPPADVVVRTGGRHRLSGFLPLQSASAELCFVETLWPAFTRAELDAVVDAIPARNRRTGA